MSALSDQSESALAARIEAALEVRDPGNPYCTARQVEREAFARWLAAQLASDEVRDA